MSTLSEYVALELNNESISLEEVLKFAKWRGLSDLIEQAIEIVLIRQATSERGITVTDDEIQQEADNFRAERDLHDASTTEEWLATNHLSFVEWEAQLENEILRRKLRQTLTLGKVEQYFTEHRLSFDAAAISRLVVKTEDVARELRAQIVEDGLDFYALARQHTIDATSRPSGGYFGVVRRMEMEADLEGAVFGAEPGTTVGPIKTDNGWELIKLEELHRGKLDEVTRQNIETILFNDWLTERRQKARIKVPLLDIVEE
jgi:putative peptide maturation system protein